MIKEIKIMKDKHEDFTVLALQNLTFEYKEGKPVVDVNYSGIETQIDNVSNVEICWDYVMNEDLKKASLDVMIEEQWNLDIQFLPEDLAQISVMNVDNNISIHFRTQEGEYINLTCNNQRVMEGIFNYALSFAEEEVEEDNDDSLIDFVNELSEGIAYLIKTDQMDDFKKYLKDRKEGRM